MTKREAWHREHLSQNSRAAYWLGFLAQCANDDIVTAHVLKLNRRTWSALWRRGFIGWDDDTALYHVTETGHREAMRGSEK